MPNAAPSFSRPPRAASTRTPRSNTPACWLSGQGVEEDRAEAIRLLESAYAKSSPRKADAAFYLGRLLVEDQPDAGVGAAVGRPRTRADEVPSTRSALCLRSGATWPKRRHTGARPQPPGHLQAQEKLAELYHDRGQRAEAQDYGAQAMAQYRARADQGDVGAMRRLAQAYDEGILTDADPEAHWQWLERAAEAGDAVSQGVLARAYLEGRDRPVDGPRGQQWAERAIAQGYIPAKAYLGRALLRGEVLPPDLGRAETLLKEAAEAGHSAAQTDLGSCLSDRIAVVTRPRGRPALARGCDRSGQQLSHDRARLCLLERRRRAPGPRQGTKNC